MALSVIVIGQKQVVGEWTNFYCFREVSILETGIELQDTLIFRDSKSVLDDKGASLWEARQSFEDHSIFFIYEVFFACWSFLETLHTFNFVFFFRF